MRGLLLIVFLACGGSPGTSTSGTGQSNLVVQPASSGQTLVIAPGGTLQLGAFHYDSSGYGPSLQPVTATWTSGKPEVATVDRDGVVHGVASGTAVITARAGGESGTATVTVSGP